MAGIGFELRKLVQRDDLLGVAAGYSYAALATSGPWLLTILALAAILTVGAPFATPSDIASFRLIVVYNFSFSLVLTAPVAIILTRYLADSIYARDVRQAPAALLGGLLLSYLAAAPVAAALYFWHAQTAPLMRLAAFLNLLGIAGIWTAGVFLTALKEYRALMLSFASGLIAGIVLAAILGERWGAFGMLLGFDAGLAITLFTLIARIFAEYPTRSSHLFVFLPYFRKYWDLALTALAYNLAIWADKWLMWLAPERQRLAIGFVNFPDYESAMFLAYLSIVPSMAAFTLIIETRFFENYARFYDDIQRHVSYGKIHANQQAVIEAVMDGARNFVVLQGSICFVGVLLAPQILDALGVSFLQLSIFRIGLLGAFFHSGFLFLMIVLTYFDVRRITLAIALVFLVANCFLTIATLKLGFPYYGYGYFLSSLAAFAAAFLATAWILDRLPYQAFIRNNSSVAQ
jgi:polysaccharide biosynthesis protein PelG